MKNLILYIILALLISPTNLVAQDVVFSNPILSPLNLNPAFTGVINAGNRLNIIHRSQYSFLGDETFRTFSAAFDLRYPNGKYDYFGGGITFFTDKAGALDFKTQQIKISGSYIKKMGSYISRRTFLSLAFEVGYTKKNIDLNNAQWGSQHNGRGEFDSELFSGNSLYNHLNTGAVDIGAGLLFFISDNKNAKNLYVGGAYHHINKIDESFNSDLTVLANQRITLHAGGEFPIDGNSKRIRLLPKVIFNAHSPAMQLLSGASLRYVLARGNYDNIFIQFGSALRIVDKIDSGFTADALVFQLRLDYNDLSVGLSYDATISTLNSATNGVGAFELGMLYRFSGKNNRNIFCPSF